MRLVLAEEAATLLELELEPGAGAGSHTHSREDELVAVVEGTLVVDDGTRCTVEAGDAAFLPRGTRHAFANESDARLRAHIFCTPGGLEHFFRDVAAASSEDDVAAAAARAGIVFG